MVYTFIKEFPYAYLGEVHLRERGMAKGKFLVSRKVKSSELLTSNKQFQINEEKKIIINQGKFRITAKSRPQDCPQCKSKKSVRRTNTGSKNWLCKICGFNW